MKHLIIAFVAIGSIYAFSFQYNEDEAIFPDFYVCEDGDMPLPEYVY